MSVGSIKSRKWGNRPSLNEVSALSYGDKGFSGVLLHHGLRWKARADISTTWSVAGLTRKQAVKNCVEDTIKSFADFEAARLRQDTENERRRQRLATLNEQLRQTICADANMHQMEKPAINSVVFNGLSTKEIKLFFGVVVESFKRGVNVLPK